MSLGMVALRLAERAARIGVPLTFTRDVGRSRVRIPVSGGAGLTHWKVAEPWMEAVIRRALPLRPGAFVDVGAHVGETLLAFLAAGGAGAYVALEPSPDAAEYIRALCRANRIAFVTVVPCALAAAPGVTYLQGADPFDPSASTLPDFRPEQAGQPVQTVVALPGDQVVASLSIERVGIVKIDVEGGELEVLQGLTGTIARDRPAIICEVLPVYDTTNDRGRRRRTRCDALTAILRERGYTIIRIRHEGHWEPLDHIPTHGDMSLVDYVFAPSEIADDFLRTSVSP